MELLGLQLYHDLFMMPRHGGPSLQRLTTKTRALLQQNVFHKVIQSRWNDHWGERRLFRVVIGNDLNALLSLLPPHFRANIAFAQDHTTLNSGLKMVLTTSPRTFTYDNFI